MAGTQAVLFDVSGVLMTARLDPARIAEILGMDLTADDSVGLVDRAVWFNRPSYDDGSSSARQFWDTVAGDCGLPEVDDRQLADLVEVDVGRTEQVVSQALAIVSDLRDCGYRVGILTNAPVGVAQGIRRSTWADGLFDSFTFSSDVHLVKPSQGIYRRAAEDIGTPADKILFIDDRRPNLRGAELAGMSTLLWISAEQAREELLGRGVLTAVRAS